jgi:hypothetical protein
MYNRQDSIDKAYNFIQGLRAKGYKYLGTPVYDITKADLSKLAKVGEKYDIPFEWLFNLIKHESANTFNPAITNSIGATGIIQFMTKIGGKTMTYAKADGSDAVTTSELRKMSFSEQLDYLDGYLKRNLKKHLTPEGKIPETFTQGDIFMTIFYPVSVGNPNYQFPDSVSRANAGIKKPLDYVEKALKNSVFPLSVVPYSLADVKKKFGEAYEYGEVVVKRNWIPIVIIGLGLVGLTYYGIKTGKFKFK